MSIGDILGQLSDGPLFEKMELARTSVFSVDGECMHLNILQPFFKGIVETYVWGWRRGGVEGGGGVIFRLKINSLVLENSGLSFNKGKQCSHRAYNSFL